MASNDKDAAKAVDAVTTPDKPAAAAPKNEEVVADIGHLRVKTAAEKRVEAETGNKEDHWLRPAKEAHADAAKVSIVAPLGAESETSDLADDELTRIRLLFDWHDGQGVFHERGKQMDMIRNEAAKLLAQGMAERVNPPPVDPVEKAMAEAKLNALK
ncbi:hypothetical protein [Paracoccus aminovorans]|uniref:hypothetical protein n=1 Tax=Paracoccus aminovorans TaxID=34004 RepID=UPI000784C7B0|nr:hypothetical protein [Paracoccus aminovorans]